MVHLKLFQLFENYGIREVIQISVQYHVFIYFW